MIREEQLHVAIPKFTEELDKFESLLSTAEKEEDIQKFLKEHIWILGAEYLYSQPIQNVSQFAFEDSKFDFFLQRFDTFFDIIEIKLPRTELFVGATDSNRTNVSRAMPMSAKLGQAISQIIHYLEITTYKKDSLATEDKINVYKPRGIIIIGKTLNNQDRNRLKSVSSHLVNIEILSYDMLYDKAKTFIDHISNR